MKVGVAKEIKPDEYRVALTPAGALELVQAGHEVSVETGAGDGSAFADSDVFDNYMRFCIAREDEILKSAMEKLQAALKSGA